MWSRRLSVVLRTVGEGLAVGLVGFTALGSCLEIITFSGPSMQPTIREREIGFSEKITPFKKLKRGDIVIAISPDNPRIRICKRIVAMEGDEVGIVKPSTLDLEDLSFTEVRKFVPRGYVWLEGDNRRSSHDSRHYGAVPLGLVTSRVACKVNFSEGNVTWFPRGNPS